MVRTRMEVEDKENETSKKGKKKILKSEENKKENDVE